MSGPGDPRNTGSTVSPWRGMGPELVITAAVITLVILTRIRETAFEPLK